MSWRFMFGSADLQITADGVRGVMKYMCPTSEKFDADAMVVTGSYWPDTEFDGYATLRAEEFHYTQFDKTSDGSTPADGTWQDTVTYYSVEVVYRNWDWRAESEGGAEFLEMVGGRTWASDSATADDRRSILVPETIVRVSGVVKDTTEEQIASLQATVNDRDVDVPSISLLSGKNTASILRIEKYQGLFESYEYKPMYLSPNSASEFGWDRLARVTYRLRIRRNMTGAYASGLTGKDALEKGTPTWFHMWRPDSGAWDRFTTGQELYRSASWASLWNSP